jgi:hypothetical protein
MVDREKQCLRDAVADFDKAIEIYGDLGDFGYVTVNLRDAVQAKQRAEKLLDDMQIASWQ